MAIDLPQFLPDGSVLVMDHDFVDRLKNGDPTIGWLGDERLGVYQEGDCLAIKRLCEDGVLRTICRSKPGVRYLNTETLRYLARHDSRGEGHDVIDRIIAQNDGVRAQQRAALKDMCDDFADRMEFALMKDVGTTEGSGLRHRLYTVGSIKKGSDAAE